MISIILVWVIFGGLHSILATDCAKALASSRLGLSLTRYRQIYNVLAILTVIFALYVSHISLRTEILIWRDGWLLIPAVAWGVAVLFFVVAAKGYDLDEFAGTGRFRRHTENDSSESSVVGNLAFSWSHRFVRHPWYFALLMMLWIRNLTVGWLIANICITIYIIIGVTCEERRLLHDHSVWRRYKSVVPALIPLPGRTLSMAQLRTLIADDKNEIAHTRVVN